MTVKGMDLTLFSVFPVRGHGNIPSSYTLAAFLYQVDIPQSHLAWFSCFSAHGGHESIPTAHTLAAFLYQVDILPDHQA